MKTAIATQLKPVIYDAVLIAGPDNNPALLEEIKQTYDKKGLRYCIVGDGKSPVTRTQVKQALTGHIDSRTRLDIWAHGNIKDGILINDIGENGDYSVGSLFDTISECAGGVESECPEMQVHCWICFGGIMANEIKRLPKGASLFTHASKDHPSLIAMNVQGMKEGIARYPTSSMQEFAQTVIHSPETATFSRNVNGRDIHITARGPAQPLVSEGETERYLKNQLKTFATKVTRHYQGLYTKQELNALEQSIETTAFSPEDAKTYNKYSCIVECERDNTVFVEKFLNDTKIHPDSITLGGRTAIFYANSAKMVNLLAEKGADLNAKDLNSLSPLHLAVSHNKEAIVEALLEKGAEVNVRDDVDETPLISAAMDGNVPMAKRLLAYGAEINAEDEEKLTSLHWAVSEGHKAMVEFLVNWGADLTKEDENGMTPLDKAVSGGNIEIVSLLLEGQKQKALLVPKVSKKETLGKHAGKALKETPATHAERVAKEAPAQKYTEKVMNETSSTKGKTPGQ